jgi:catechol 2,3-dioxygenase-like lactoylglutathione lyase family enzyme
MEFRSARHTDNLQQLEEFYTNIIGLKVLFSFENHNDYSGVFLGKQGLNWHLEFTTSNDKAEHQFDVEDVLVFYPTEKAEYDKIVEQIEVNNIEILKSKNPFWNDNGIMIQDPDGFGVIVSHLKIK